MREKTFIAGSGSFSSDSKLPNESLEPLPTNALSLSSFALALEPSAAFFLRFSVIAMQAMIVSSTRPTTTATITVAVLLVDGPELAGLVPSVAGVDA